MSRTAGTRRKRKPASSAGESRWTTRTSSNRTAQLGPQPAGPEPALAHRAAGRIHPPPAVLVDPLDRHARQPGTRRRSARPRSCPRSPASHPAAAPAATRRGRRAGDRGSRCSKTSTAMTASKLRPGRGAAGPWRGRDPGRPPRRASPRRGRSPRPMRRAPRGHGRTGPCRSRGRESAGRFDRSQGLDDPAQAVVVAGRARLEPAVEEVEPGGDLGFVGRDHDAALPRSSSRSFQVRTATDSPESAQNMSPSRPSRKPCLPR